MIPKRSFSSSAQLGKEFIAIIKDKPGTYETRMGIRPTHMEGAHDLFGTGALTSGGGVAMSHPQEGQQPQLEGSVMTIEAESKEEVIKVLKNDVYYKKGIWDVDNALIMAVCVFDYSEDILRLT